MLDLAYFWSLEKLTLLEVKGSTTLSSPISVHIKYFFIYTYTPFVSSHTQGLNNAPLEITLLHMALQCHVPSRLEAVPPSHYIRIPYCHPIMTWPRATTSPHIPGSVPPTRHVQALFYTLPTRRVLIILILAKLSKQKRQHRRIYLQWSRIGLAHIFKQPFPKLNPPPPHNTLQYSRI